MPEWIHDRAAYILKKSKDMPEGQAFAIATQQAHAIGKAPKGYGTEQGKQEAKAKYDTPGDDQKTAKLASPYAGYLGPVQMNEAGTSVRREIGQPGSGVYHVMDLPVLDDTRAKRRQKGSSKRDKTASAMLSAFLDELPKIAAATPLRSKESIGALVSPSLVRVNTLPSPAPSDQEFGDEKESVKVGYSVSQYSGPLSYGRFKQESYVPPFNMPQLKTAGPPSEVGRVKRASDGGGDGGDFYGGGGWRRIKQESYLPPFYMPQLKTAGPPSEVGRVKHASEDDLDFYGDSDMPRIKHESGLPPFRMPALRRKTAAALAGTSFSPGKNVGGGGTTVGSGGSGGLLGPPKVKFSPGAQLARSQNVAKVPTTPPGPTVATIAKPIGYGRPMPGATKTLSA